MKIEGRTFIISGGASGLGRATAAELIKFGGYISVLDVNETTGAAIVESLDKGKSAFFKADVTSSESIAEAVEGTLKWIEKTGKPLGGVIAAAGVGFPGKIIDRDGNPLDMGTFDYVININLRGTVDLVRQVVPHLVKNEGEGPDKERGVIVMVASSAAFDGQPGQVSYSASKGAVAAMTLPLARDIARYGIRAVTIAPSLFDSPMTEAMSDKVRASLVRVMEWPPRPGQPPEFALLARHIIENTMLNGETIRLDGAMRMPSKM